MTEPRAATPEGTLRYARRAQSFAAEGHFREMNGLMVSTIGLGTYLGHWDDRTDRMYQDSIKRSIELGANVIDSAINYRFQRSERSIGLALKQLFTLGKASRDEIIVATKGGFFSFDSEPPRDARAWVIENFIEPGVARPEDIVDSHCMSPTYLENQLNRSLENLGLESVDVYYIHNPETQFDGVERDEFARRIRAAFEYLEKAAGEGKLSVYGVATWNGFRRPSDARDYLSLAELQAIAREVGGEQHHFGVIQLPFNLAMPEALTFPNQHVEGQVVSTLEAAGLLGITVMCSASILQAKLTRGLPSFVGDALTGLNTDAQRAIQFVRSAPGVTTALIGMSQRSHVEENLMVAKTPPASIEDYLRVFSERSGSDG